MRRLQWLKTRTGLFSDPRMLCLMNQANGDSYIVLWFFLKDMAGTVNDNGLVYVSGQEAMTTQLIAKCLHRRRPFIEKGLTLLEKLNSSNATKAVLSALPSGMNYRISSATKRSGNRRKNGSAATVRGSAKLSGKIVRWMRRLS